jgi:hypothetical protein
MDDFVLSNLQESRNEWCARLVSIFTPLVIEGIRSIFNESWNMCVTQGETSKYLMSFQNLLSRIPKWNNVIVEEERKRIIERSSCGYLEDLITCVHIIQLKVLTCVRVGNRMKQLDISTPKLDTFIHKVYINVARQVYKNVYLFEKNVSPLVLQKNNRELEIIVQECILNTIRESIPTEAIIRAYLDESVEQEEEVIIENLETPDVEKSTNDIHDENKNNVNEIIPQNKEEIIPEVVPTIKNIDNDPIISRLTFNNIDNIIDTNDNNQSNELPKSIDQLEKISMDRNMQRKFEEQKTSINGYESDDDRIKITGDEIDLTDFDILDEKKNELNPSDEILNLDFEELV